MEKIVFFSFLNLIGNQTITFLKNNFLKRHQLENQLLGGCFLFIDYCFKNFQPACEATNSFLSALCSENLVKFDQKINIIQLVENSVSILF